MVTEEAVSTQAFAREARASAVAALARASRRRAQAPPTCSSRPGRAPRPAAAKGRPRLPPGAAADTLYSSLSESEVLAVAQRRASADLAAEARLFKLRSMGLSESATASAVASREAELSLRSVSEAVASGEGPACWAQLPQLRRELDALGLSEDRRRAVFEELHSAVEPDVARARHDFYEFPLARRTAASALDLYEDIVRKELRAVLSRLRKERAAVAAQVDTLQTRLLGAGARASALPVPPKWLVKSGQAAKSDLPLYAQKAALAADVQRRRSDEAALKTARRGPAAQDPHKRGRPLQASGRPNRALLPRR